MTLVLTRAEGEGFSVDGPAVLRFELTTAGDPIRVIIDCPRTTHVQRLEIKNKHDCGPLCPEHGDPRDTNIDPKQQQFEENMRVLTQKPYPPEV